MGLTVPQLAEAMQLSEREIYRLQVGPHHCPCRSAIMLLRAWLQEPDLIDRLAGAGYPHPWPEDVAA